MSESNTIVHHRLTQQAYEQFVKALGGAAVPIITDNPQETAFRLGVQYALEKMRVVLVIK